MFDCLWFLCVLIVARWVSVSVLRGDATQVMVQRLMAQRILLAQNHPMAVLGDADDYSSAVCHNFTSAYLGISDQAVADTVCSRIYWVPERRLMAGQAHEVHAVQDEMFALPQEAVRDMCSQLIKHNPALIPDDLIYYAIVVYADVCKQYVTFDQLPT